MTRYAVVVDPLSTGQFYPAAFRAAGVQTIAVLSVAELAAAFQPSWHPENFARVLVDDGDPDRLAAQLRRYDPLCVVLGAEGGVELADALVDRLLPGSGNVPELAAARRDKWGTGQALRAAGVPHLRQVCGADPDAVDRELRAAGLWDRPVVVKPPKSSGTDNVHLAATGAQWRQFFPLIHGRPNSIGRVNEAVLVEEYAAGTEYLVDTYSADGVHGLVDVCRYTKQRRGDLIGVYDLVDFLPPDDPVLALLGPYVRRVLDAIGVRNGCGHAEVIVTDAGPRLVEVAVRPAGGGHQMITELATGTNQIERTVAHRVRGEFDPGYRLVRFVCSVVISSPRSGVWRNADLFDGVDALPTFHAKHFYYGTGDVVPAPAGLYSMLGWVVLASADHDAMQADYRRIRELERSVLVTDPQPSQALTR